MSNKSSKKVVMLVGEGDYPVMVYNYLRRQGINIDKVIIEKPISTSTFLKRRIKNIGWVKVIGQVLNRIFIVPFLRWSSRKRFEEIVAEGNLDSTPIPESQILRVPSVNSDSCISALEELDPEVVGVVNTRILSGKTLQVTQAGFINIHAGITPGYRGWHGAYWALVRKDLAHCGVTVHKIDEGIDTGRIMYQDTIAITDKDNYYTYPYLQLVKGLPLYKRAIEDMLNGEETNETDLATEEDYMYSHPTIWEYIANRVLLDVK